MKYFSSICIIVVIVFFCSCNFNKNKETGITKTTESTTESAVQKEETTLEYGTAAEILSREIKDFSDV